MPLFRLEQLPQMDRFSRGGCRSLAVSFETRELLENERTPPRTHCGEGRTRGPLAGSLASRPVFTCWLSCTPTREGGALRQRPSASREHLRRAHEDRDSCCRRQRRECSWLLSIGCERSVLPSTPRGCSGRNSVRKLLGGKRGGTRSGATRGFTRSSLQTTRLVHQALPSPRGLGTVLLRACEP